MVITDAKFVKSSSTLQECPSPNKPEYAFIGRSNVGKSSLLNMLCQRKNLAKTSGTPGKTRLINHYLINNQWYFVDLPGYGYAKLSKKERLKFTNLINDYLLHRSNLVSLFVLVDSRHPPMEQDLDFINNLGKNGIPFSIVFTKTDKLKPMQLENNTLVYKKRLLQDWAEIPQLFFTSVITQKGRDEILQFIEKLNKQ
ncbi:ribosome biogenesis GTP-binding protein YihA/YsxC [Thermophagus xiamenensis]|uniref:Probable GTP-binding protein EngB n=1 Tax=Thermophagus xiamenensis TaxID=385682 RepID=A0A1I2FZF7_9BACT|nr:ribosome biogenesis GTP-binding protein YihA/YsxC [Thermophagus xiamenensis]SFF10198.1 GTP-binding protein [Thermophagus xiamenensis]